MTQTPEALEETYLSPCGTWRWDDAVQQWLPVHPDGPLLNRELPRWSVAVPVALALALLATVGTLRYEQHEQNARIACSQAQGRAEIAHQPIRLC